MASTELVYGSLGYLAAQGGKTIAESFAFDVVAIIMLDISASMREPDCPNGQTRYACACDELRRLQRELPGKIAVIEWASGHAFMAGGLPSPPSGMTNMAGVLKYVHRADDCGIRFILISDGEPDIEFTTLDEARKFKSKIDTIYIGPEDGTGADFLRRLAALTGGRAETKDARGIVELSRTIKGLLTA